jgi:hypothetical protein
MRWSDEAQETISRYLEDPANPSAQRDLGSMYWRVLAAGLGEQIRTNADWEGYINENKEFIDFGFVPEIRESLGEGAVAPAGTKDCALQVQYMSDWLKMVIERMRGNFREETLRGDIRTTEIQAKRLTGDLAGMQESRRDMLLQQLSSAEGGRLDDTTRAQISELTKTDEMTLNMMRARREVSRGAKLSIADRQKMVHKEMEFQKVQARGEALLSRVQGEAFKSELRNTVRQINEIFTQRVAQEEKIARLEAEIASIHEQRETMPAGEQENRITAEIEYVRDLIRLSAKRLRVQSCSILRPEELYFGLAQVRECLDVIFEFDPKILRNDRVSFMGKPSVLIIPGNGSALYDWKNNCFVVPLAPPGGKFMESIVAAIIEYRLDVDEEKNLLHAYCKLPHLKAVRSVIQIKANFAKDYTMWLMSESKGYKVMNKDTRAWFEHMIAPSKNEIYCPPQYQEFAMSQAEFKKLVTETEERLSNISLTEAPPSDLWAASIFSYQLAKYERSLECIKAYVQMSPQVPFGHYNLAQISLKAGNKSDAAVGFAEFAKQNPRSWWASVAQDYLRKLVV